MPSPENLSAEVEGDIEDVNGVLTNESYLDYHVRHSMAFAEYFGVSTGARMITSIPLGSGASSGAGRSTAWQDGCASEGSRSS